MEELQKKHRQEQKDLQTRITQKKKNTNKKTRKGVNDECAQLEHELKKRQLAELTALDGNPDLDRKDDIVEEAEPGLKDHAQTPDAPAKDVPEPDSQPVRKRNRQKERLARRAAEQEEVANKAEAEASNQTDHRAKEREIMESQFTARGLIEQEVRSDGHCLYAAMADQLEQNDIAITLDLPGYKVVRRDAATFITEHADDFLPFLEEPLEDYVVKIRDTAEWGGQLELLALSRVYGIKIHVLQGDGRVEKIEPGEPTDKEAWLAYYRHSFGLGEHYNSLRRKRP